MAKKAKNLSEAEAKHGEKMIEVKVRFWTNDMASEPSKVIQKHAWMSGVVRIERNDSHGIVPGKPKPFNSLLEIGSAIEDLLIEQGIILHPSRKMRRYMGD